MAYLKEATYVNSINFMLLGVLKRYVRLHEKCNDLMYTFSCFTIQLYDQKLLHFYGTS